MKEIIRLFHELSYLKNQQRTGWLTLGLFQGDSIASHSFRVAIIAYYLAKKLNADVEKVVLMSLFHDVPESRIADLNKVHSNYVKVEEERAIREQLKDFPEIINLLLELEKRESLEAKIVHDADQLELILQAKEYELLNPLAKDFYVKKKEKLLLEESKALYEEIINSEVKWWDGLKKDKQWIG